MYNQTLKHTKKMQLWSALNIGLCSAKMDSSAKRGDSAPKAGSGIKYRAFWVNTAKKYIEKKLYLARKTLQT